MEKLICRTVWNIWYSIRIYIYTYIYSIYIKVGQKNGNDYGQILSRDESLCPEESTGLWKYWSTVKEQWIHDSTLTTKCDGEKCCNEIVLSSSGGTRDHQETRLGKYVKGDVSENGRFEYQKEDGENVFLYWMKSYNGIWMVP